MTTLDGVRWPDHFAPENSPVHVRNELEILASVEATWACLIRAQLWPTWYSNSANVRFHQRPGPDLAAGTYFRWKTFGVTLESKVEELVPLERIAWCAHACGIDAYHAWVLRATPQGCHVLTEETQHGVLARLQKLFLPNRMYRGHEKWLQGLASQAGKGLP
jgi:uncharacterized protein YndB with AHSA1/START domain